MVVATPTGGAHAVQNQQSEPSHMDDFPSRLEHLVACGWLERSGDVRPLYRQSVDSLLTEEDLCSPTRCGVDTSGEKPAIKSKADGVRKAKQKVEALQNRSRNTLVTATKLICDVDVLRGIAILLHGSRGEWTSFNELYETLTSAAATLRHCQSWAQSGWLAGLKVTPSCLTDITGLHKCGIETDFKEF